MKKMRGDVHKNEENCQNWRDGELMKRQEKTTLDLQDVWVLEWSERMETKKLFPFQVHPLANALLENVQDFSCNENGEKQKMKWQIVFVGTKEEVYQALKAIVDREWFSRFEWANTIIMT